MNNETIVAAAVCIGGLTYSMPAPARHCNILWAMRHPIHAIPESQGFLTSKGRYVGRLEAAIIAVNAGQVEKDKLHNDDLFSEDLW